MDNISFPQHGVTMEVKVAKSLTAKAIGLAFRTSIGAGGMLFPLNGRRTSIWMMGMRFPIDIIWIARGKVVKIDHAVSPPRRWLVSTLIPYTLPRYTCSEGASHVLETTAGFCHTNGIGNGDSVIMNSESIS